MADGPRQFALAQVLSAIVAVAATPFGGGIWGVIYGTAVKGSPEALAEGMAGLAVGMGGAVLLLVANVGCWTERRHRWMAIANTIVVGLCVAPLAVLALVGWLRGAV